MSITSKKSPYLEFLEKDYLTSHHHTGEGTTGSKGLDIPFKIHYYLLSLFIKGRT